MTNRRTTLIAIAVLALGIAACVFTGAATQWLTASRTTLRCTAATEEFLRSVSIAIERGQCDSVKREIDLLLTSGSPFETYETRTFEARMQQATQSLQVNSPR